MRITKELYPAFRHNQYLFRKKVFRIFGGAYHVYDAQGNLLFYTKQKAFKLGEDFRVYSDESRLKQYLTIKTSQILDIGITYKVQDTTTGEFVGEIRRRSVTFVRDEWSFLSNENRKIGSLIESSFSRALLNKFINLIPQKFVIFSDDDRKVAEIERHFNLFIVKYRMKILDPEPSIDPRLLISSCIILAGVRWR